MWTADEGFGCPPTTEQTDYKRRQYVHHYGFIPLRPVKWPFVLNSSSEVKLSVAQSPWILTASSALSPHFWILHALSEVGQYLNISLVAKIKK